ncbi:MAG: outer membrane beta-barrel protein [Bryobacteraceae bacterium]
MPKRVFFLVVAAAAVRAEEANFAGAMAGVSTLSADGRSILEPSRTSVSLYKPENGLTWLVFGGRHLNDFLSLQASYGRNRNDLALTSVEVAGGAERSFDRRYTALHHTIAGELMLYFRPRSNFARPYLSAGPGVAHLSSAERQLTPRNFSASDFCFRVAVGIDIKLRGGAAFRYSFAETIQNNPVSAQLSPPGQRKLANFQNLFGIAWRF